MSGNAPLHEEYKLRDARKNFLSDTNKFLNSEVLKDLRESKMRQLHKIEQSKLILKRGEHLLKHLTNRRRTLDEKYRVYLDECQRQLKILHKDYRIISDEALKGEELNELFRALK